MMDWARTLFPEPDSPTTAMVCPRSTVKETPFTARTTPSSRKMDVRRPSTASNGAPIAGYHLPFRADRRQGPGETAAAGRYPQPLRTGRRHTPD